MRCGAVRFPANASRELASVCKTLASIVIRACRAPSARSHGRTRRPPGASDQSVTLHTPVCARAAFWAATLGQAGFWPFGQPLGQAGFWLPLYVAAICNEVGSRGLPCRERGSVSLARHLPGADSRCERYRSCRDGDAVRARGRDRAADGRAIRREHVRIPRRPRLHQNGPARPQRPAAPRPRGHVAGARGGLWSGTRRALDHRRARAGPLLRHRAQRADARRGGLTTRRAGPPARQAAALPFNAGWPLRGLRRALRFRVQPVRVDAHEQAADRGLPRRLPARGGPCGNQPS